MSDLAKKYAQYAARLKQYMDDRNITGEMASEMVGAHVTTIYDMRRGAQKLNDEWRERFETGFKVSADVLFGSATLPKPAAHEIFPRKRRGRKPPHVNDNLPLYGLAAASLAGNFAMTGDAVSEVPCPPALRDVVGAYALETKGESMIPRYFPKDNLYVNPHQAVRPGDHVIIQTIRDGTITETWVKRYDGESKDKKMILAWQYNPQARIEFDRRYVNFVHRVLPWNELFQG